MRKSLDYELENARRMNALDKTGLDAHSNLTVRDYFAGQALMSMLSPVQDLTKETPAVAAKWVYEFADAMMKERAK